MIDIKGITNTIIQGDCLQELHKVADGSVDMICCDPPYGTMDTDGGRKIGVNGWDKTIDHGKMIYHCNRVLRQNGSLILFSQDPYTARLMTITHGNLPFSYRLTWLKDNFAIALGCKKNPVSYTEDICVFFKRHPKHDFGSNHPLRCYAKKFLDWIGMSLNEINSDLGHRRAEHFFYIESSQFSICTKGTYDQMVMRYDVTKMDGYMPFVDIKQIDTKYRAELIAEMTLQYPRVFNLPEGQKYKSNVLEYKKDYMGLHPTQKPVKLIEDLIKTYTNEGEVVLDFTMGSGTTGVACVNLNRQFIGIEKDDKYYEIATKRVQEASDAQGLFK